MTNEITEKLARPVDTLNKQMRQLVKKNLVERRGSRKTGGYWICDPKDQSGGGGMDE